MGHPEVSCSVVSINALSLPKSLSTPLINTTITPKRGSVFSAQALPDTGATAPIIAENLIKQNNIPIDNNQCLIKAANGTEMRCLGSVDLSVEVEGQMTSTTAFVTPALQSSFYLSWFNLVDLKIIPHNFPKPMVQIKQLFLTYPNDLVHAALQPIFVQFDHVFNERDILPPMKGPPMHIHLKADVKIVPKCVLVARRIPFAFVADAKNDLESQCSAGIIEPVTWPTPWTSPVIFIPKPNGKGIRMVTEYTSLNQYFLILKSTFWHEFRQMLREFRNTPNVSGFSPAHWIFNRPQRTCLPAHPIIYARVSDDQYEEAKRRKSEQYAKRVTWADKQSHDLSPLSVGDEVLIQNTRTSRWDSKGRALPDTGATAPIIAENLIKQNNIPIDNNQCLIKAANGTEMRCLGSVDLSVEVEGQMTSTTAFVTPALQSSFYLSWFNLVDLKIIPHNFPKPMFLILKSTSWHEFRQMLREFRNTPNVSGFSPAHWIFNRPQRTCLPAHPIIYARVSDDQYEEAKRRKSEQYAKRVTWADKQSHDLSPLSVGDEVLIQNTRTSRWDSKGRVLSSLRNNRSYKIELDDGRLFYRNRRYLKQI
ncbi:hypothetical protein TCAL_15990 [Tigriopus californicus]|uniref:Peptidase A2 domain-containing protein n=1 Tax=Tigriopus californicus TaxID=6832 RepID=A0A553PHL9_TIGCA|nr:hypothetical protein TCAL_15990 [Tigriopus californicus]